MDEQDQALDEQLNMLIVAASQSIEHYCKRTFRKTLHTERYDGGTKEIALHHFPVHSVKSVTATQEGSLTDYELFPDGTLWRETGWPAGARSIKVVYEAGYILPNETTETEPQTLPQCVELACLRYVQLLYEGQIGKTSERLGDYAVTYAQAAEGNLPQAVVLLLQPSVGRWL